MSLSLFLTGKIEVTGSTVTKYYYLGGQRVAMSQNGTVYYLHGDHLGSTNVVSGAAISQQTYYAYGLPRTTEGTLPTDYAFTGQRQDSDGLLYYEARYYEASLNRWTQPDSVIPDFYNPQYLNRYTYGLNNPVKYRDPTGHRVCEDAECRVTEGDTVEERKDSIWRDLAFDFGANVDTRFSLQQMRIIQSAFYRFEDLAGGAYGVRKAVGGVNVLPGTKSEASYRAIYLNDVSLNDPTAASTVMHELAHVWDFNTSALGSLDIPGKLVDDMAAAVGDEKGPTSYARDKGPVEDWAESVRMFVYPEYKEYMENYDSEKYLDPPIGLYPRHWTYAYNQFENLKWGGR